MWLSKYSVGSVAIVLFAASVEAQVKLLNLTIAQYPQLSATCVGVLNQVVACDESINWAGRGRYEQDVTLTALCTAACTTGLTTWHRRVMGACTTRFDNGKGSLVLPQIWSQNALDQYNLICMQQSGSFCNAVIRTKAGINPDNQKQTASAAATLLCEDCVIKSLSAQQQMQLMSMSEMASRYSVITSSCKKTTFTFTPIVTTSYIIPATGVTPSPVPSSSACVGASYTIKTGDNCRSISKANGISTDRLLRTNSLSAFCSAFPAVGKVLCISTKDKCTTYTVKSTDTCALIGTANRRTWTQIVRWNPEVGTTCSQLSKYEGYEICISQPGGTWINPSPAVTSATSTLPPRTGTPVTLIPKPTYVGNFTLVETVFGNDTRMDCDRYLTGKDLPQSCAAIASGFDQTLAQLLEWNPSLVGKQPCVLRNDTQYCVQRISHIAKNITESCVNRDIALPGASLSTFLANWGLSLSTFALWNPIIKADGSGYKTGYEYCVAANHFRQPGIIAICNQFAVANITQFLQKPCQIIETKFGLSHARFVAWNPAVKTDCSEIIAGADYCVSIPNYKPVYSTTTAYTPAASDLVLPTIPPQTTTSRP